MKCSARRKCARTRISGVLIMLIFGGLASGCGKGWQMDYGKPAAQFHAHDVARIGKPFIGKKITVKGEVLRVENREDGNHIYLKHNIHCVFPTWHLGEDNLKMGDEIFVDGFLEKCTEGNVELYPALGRDSAASFKPIE
jgi:hypothetical protein